MSGDSLEETVGHDEVRAIAAERLVFFADAVIAIAITLLALELPAPKGSTNAEFLHSVNENRNEYIAFLISFAVIGSHWRAHHRMFRYVTKLGGWLVRLSLGWLLMQILTPFATKVIAENDAFESRFIFYASVQVISLILFMLMVVEIRRHKLYREDTPPERFGNAISGAGRMAAGFAVSIPVAFFTQWAYACWLVVPWATVLVLRLKRRH